MAVYPAPLVTGSLPHPGTAADLAPSGTAAASAAEHTPSGAAPTAPAASASSLGSREDIYSYTRSFVLAHGAGRPAESQAHPSARQILAYTFSHFLQRPEVTENIAQTWANGNEMSRVPFYVLLAVVVALFIGLLLCLLLQFIAR